MANNDNQNKACPNKCYWINQGLIYVLIVLITMISTISFLKLLKFGAGDPSFVSMFEFGATLSSIILSVVAIVYTLIQSKQSETITSKIVDASDMIEEHSETLNNSITGIANEVNNLKEMNLDETLKKHMDKFDIKLKELQEITDGGFKKVSNDVNTILGSGFLGRGNNSGSELVSNINKATLETIAENILLKGNHIRYHCYLVFKFYLANLSYEKDNDLWFKFAYKLDKNLKGIEIFNQLPQENYISIMCISLNALFGPLDFVDRNYKFNIDVTEILKTFKDKESSAVGSIDNVLEKIFAELDSGN